MATKHSKAWILGAVVVDSDGRWHRGFRSFRKSSFETELDGFCRISGKLTDPNLELVGNTRASFEITVQSSII